MNCAICNSIADNGLIVKDRAICKDCLMEIKTLTGRIEAKM